MVFDQGLVMCYRGGVVGVSYRNWIFEVGLIW